MEFSLVVVTGIVCFFLGGLFGFMVMAVCTASAENSQREDEEYYEFCKRQEEKKTEKEKLVEELDINTTEEV